MRALLAPLLIVLLGLAQALGVHAHLPEPNASGLHADHGHTHVHSHLVNTDLLSADHASSGTERDTVWGTGGDAVRDLGLMLVALFVVAVFVADRREAFRLPLPLALTPPDVVSPLLLRPAPQGPPRCASR